MVDRLQQVVDILAGQLRRSVVIDDQECRLLCSSAHFGDEDELRITSLVRRSNPPELVQYLHSLGLLRWHAPTHVPPRPDLGFRSRLCVPLRSAGTLFGFMYLVDTDPIRADEMTVVERAAEEVTQVLRRRAANEVAEGAELENLVRDVIVEDLTVASAAASDLTALGYFTSAQRVTMIVVRDPSAAPEAGGLHSTSPRLLDRVARALRRADPAVTTLPAEAESSVVILVGAVQQGVSRSAAQMIAEQILQHLEQGGSTAHIGIGRTVSSLAAAALSFRQATVALRTSEAGISGAVSAFDDLGPYAVLASLAPSAPSPAWTTVETERLEDVATDDLVRTLEVFLDAGGDAHATAEQLFVHRSTVYYRLGRIEKLLGRELSDGRLRLELHLWVKLRRLYGRVPQQV